MGKYLDKINLVGETIGFSSLEVLNTLQLMAQAFDELNDKIDKLGESKDKPKDNESGRIS